MRPIFVNKFSIVTLLIVATATISLMACNANAQSLPEQPPTSGGSDEIQTQPIETPPSSSEKTGEVNTGSDSEDEERYAPDHVLIGYKDPAPALENEDETGIIYLRDYGTYEATFISRGLAVISEDFASVGVDTAGLEIFGGDESINQYYVRYNADIDPLQLSIQLMTIDRIAWVQPNYRPTLADIGILEPYEDHGTAVSENVEQDYAPDHVLIKYKNPAPVLENEDETGIIYLRNGIAFEATFVSRGLAVVSEDFASVGVDTADLEIFGGSESRNTYHVRFNADIDPLQLSRQLRAIDRIVWAQPNYIYELDTDDVTEVGDEVNTGSEDEELSYEPDVVLIRYKDPAPALENEDETGTTYLKGTIPYEVAFISRGLAVVSEDFASVGVDTADLEILGGIESSNTYFVGFNADIDPPQLSIQLRTIDRIDWAQPSFIYEIALEPY